MSNRQDAVNRMLAGFKEYHETAEEERRHLWDKKSNREKAEALIARVNHEHVFERDMPVLALAQVHATLALTERNYHDKETD